MKFQTYASQETAALIGALLGEHARATLDQLTAVRNALDAASHALSMSTLPDDSIRDLVARLTGAADAEVRRIREETDAAQEALRGELQAQHTECARLAAALDSTEADARSLRAALQASEGRAEAAERDRTNAADAQAALENTLKSLQADLVRAREAAATTELELADTHTTVQELLADVEQLKGEIDRQASANASLNEQLTRAREVYAERDAVKAQLQESLERVRTLDGELAQAGEARAQFEQDLTHASEGRAQLERELAQASDAREQLAESLNETRQAREQLEEELSQAQIVRAELDGKLAASAERLDALQNELAKATGIRGQRDALAGELRASNARVRTLEADLARANKIGEQRDTLAAELDASQAQVLTLETDLIKANGVREQRDGLLAQVNACTARIHALEQMLGRATKAGEQRDTLAVEFEAATARIRALETELTRAASIRDERDRLAGETEATGTRILTLEQELAAARDARDERDLFAVELEEAQARLQRVETELATAQELRTAHNTAVLESERRAAQIQMLEEALASAMDRLAAQPEPGSKPTGVAAADEYTDQLHAEIDRLTSLFDTSVRAVSELAVVNDSSQLLEELVKRLALQFSRVALFRLHGERLVGEHQIGLDETLDIATVVILPSEDSMLTRASKSGAVQGLYGEDVPRLAGTPFGGSPRSAMALPIRLHGTTLAVIYGDDAGTTETPCDHTMHESNVSFARLLVGQTEVLLVRHTQQLKTLAELSQYATTLLQEAREMHLADTQAGKKPDLVRSRLKDNIDCASQLYAYRAAMEGTAAAALLDQQILSELQESTPFANDLASVMAEMARNDLNITAEA